MRNLVFKFVLLSLFAVASVSVAAQDVGKTSLQPNERPFPGAWEGKMESDGRTMVFDIVIAFGQNRGKLDGALTVKPNTRAVSLTGITVYANGVINFSVPGAGGIETRFEGRLTGDTIAGTWRRRMSDEVNFTGKWSLKKSTAPSTRVAAVNTENRDKEVFLPLIQSQLASNRIADAITTATNCITQIPSSAPCYALRSNLYLRVYKVKPIDLAKLRINGKQDQDPDWQKAVADISKAVSLVPNVAEYYYQRGLTYIEGYNSEPFGLAIADAKKAIELEPSRADAKKLLERATDGYASGLAKEAADKWVLSSGGRAEGDKAASDKLLAEAIAQITTSISIGPGYSKHLNYLMRARMQRDLGKLELAVEDYTASIALKKNHGDAFIERAETYRKLRKFALAFADYDALAALPDDFETKYPKQRVPLGRADGYRESGDLPRAVAEYTKILAANPDDAGALYGRGLAHYYNKNRTAAAADFEKLVATSWDKEGMKKELGRLDIAPYNAQYPPIPAGRGRAEEIARTVDAMIGEVAEVAQKGDTKAAEAKLATALAEADKAVAADRTSAKAHEARGGVLLVTSLVVPARAAELLRNALASYETAIAADPKSSRAYFGRGVVYERMGDKAKARADQQKALQLDPKNGDAETALKRLGN
ncbi:MAG: tetratricopeptide repeat protein [Acidobacteria bacterium]|nr:tetratricopeptide repeat protein [Acidobacteriota bacterium]